MSEEHRISGKVEKTHSSVFVRERDDHVELCIGDTGEGPRYSPLSCNAAQDLAALLQMAANSLETRTSQMNDGG